MRHECFINIFICDIIRIISPPCDTSRKMYVSNNKLDIILLIEETMRVSVTHFLHCQYAFVHDDSKDKIRDDGMQRMSHESEGANYRNQ